MNTNRKCLRLPNIFYKSDKLSKKYSNERLVWDEFYPSERSVFDRVGFTLSNKILDLGCGCGGLGLVLKKRYGVKNYTGIDINNDNIENAKSINPDAILNHGDILDQKFNPYIRKFDRVISLSCIDWNNETDHMIDRAWSFVSPGGVLISSMRLTNEKTIKDIKKAYQHIDENEIAQYTIFNTTELLKTFSNLNPRSIYAYGYWGDIKSNTVAPYKKVVFSVFAISKKYEENIKGTSISLNIPSDSI